MADHSHGGTGADSEAAESGQTTIGASPAAVSQPAASPRREVWLVAVLVVIVAGLVLIVAGIALSPFWAPEVAPLLPWGARPAVPRPDYAAFAARLEAIERRPTPPAIDVGAIGSAQSALAHRVDQLEAARSEDRQSEAPIVSIKAGLQQLERQLGTIEAQAALREAGDAAETRKVQQELTRLGAGAAGLADRLEALEQRSRAQARAPPPDAILLVALLQMREAVEQARPFAAELSAFTALAHDRPDLLAAIAPLGEIARDGVVGRFALAKHLAEVAGHIASATTLPPEADWEAQVLARLRALITIRRIEGAPQSEPEAALRAAEVALGGGDLGEAVAQLDRLTGASAEAARPWLRMARQRLAVEKALGRSQDLLVIRLEHPSEEPGRAPADAPVKPG
jgi:hypothetical protein